MRCQNNNAATTSEHPWKIWWLLPAKHNINSLCVVLLRHALSKDIKIMTISNTKTTWHQEIIRKCIISVTSLTNIQFIFSAIASTQLTFQISNTNNNRVQINQGNYTDVLNLILILASKLLDSSYACSIHAGFTLNTFHITI